MLFAVTKSYGILTCSDGFYMAKGWPFGSGKIFFSYPLFGLTFIKIPNIYSKEGFTENKNGNNNPKNLPIFFHSKSPL